MLTRWKSIAVGALALMMAGLIAPVSAMQESTNVEIMQVRSTYHHVNSSIHDALQAQVEYAIARASEDEPGMQQAAAVMLVSLAETRFWLAILDAQVTASQFSDKIDKQVADLNALAIQAFDTIGIALLTNDMQTFNSRLDESADFFNRLSLDLGTLRSSLGPELTGPS